MILHALYDYYERRQADPDPSRRLPEFGLEQKEIGFILELSTTGELKGITDTRRQIGNKKIGIERRVPKGVKRASGVAANLLWDNAEYVLAIPDAKKLKLAQKNGSADEYLARLEEMQAAFRARIEALPQAAQADDGIRAVLAFLETTPASQARQFSAAWSEIATSNPTLSLRLIGDADVLVSQRPGVLPHVAETVTDGEGAVGRPMAQCLITGELAPVERLHTAIKNVWNAQTSGANIVSFNLDAFSSYGKSQGMNAPVSHAAAFAYTTALNALLARESAQRVQVGDASTVFWAQRPDPLEGELAQLLGGSTDDPDTHVRQVRNLFESVRTGTFSGARGENKFFVLGLAPNAARIAVRFWHAAPLAEIARRLTQWFEDLAIVCGPNDAEFPTMFRLLAAVAVQGRADNIPPRLGGDIVRCIFTGGPFPSIWLSAAVRRCRAEQQVNHLRAAAIKACLNRSNQFISGGAAAYTPEIKAMLDPDNPSTAYRLGRLFATLEKIQEEASPGLNTSIRERYYGAASSAPVTVFTTLMRLKNHHLAKISSRGRAVNFERLLTAIMSDIEDFPAHMSLPEQGRFAIGYYHQRQAFFVKAESDATDATQGTL